MEENQSPLKFPCKYPITLFGLNSEELRLQTATIIRRHIKGFDKMLFQCKESRNGKYISLKAYVYVEDRKKLEDIYKDLSTCKLVLMTL